MTQEPSQGNEDTKKWLNLSVFMLSLMKSGEPWKNVIGHCDKYELSVVKWETEKPVGSDSSWFSSVFGDNEVPFLWVWGGHLSHEGLVTCFRRRAGNPSATHIPSA